MTAINSENPYEPLNAARAAHRQHLTAGFIAPPALAAPVQKALTPDEFQEKYGKGHEVYTDDGLSRFEAAFLEKGQEGGRPLDELKQEIVEIRKSLTPAQVQYGQVTVTRHVRPSAAK